MEKKCCRCGVIKDAGAFYKNRLLADGMDAVCSLCASTARKDGLYSVWRYMLRRCIDPRDKAYAHYGGRGISVCDRWLDRKAFVADMGPRPSHRHQIDRIDTNGNYEPGNCRWATPKEQSRNTRRNVLVTIDGHTRCVAEWAEVFGISPHRIHQRLKGGWDPVRAVSCPIKGRV